MMGSSSGPLLLLAFALQFALFASALYTPQDAVVQLNADNFEEKVIRYKGVAVVEFFAPWCGHCKNLAPVYKQIAEKLKGLALVGAVDCEDSKAKQLCATHGIRGFPTVKLFPPQQDVNPYTKKLSKIPEDLAVQPSLRSVNDAVSNLYNDKYIKRLSEMADYTAWATEAADIPKVLLFTSKSSTTVLYKSLSTQFRQRLAFAEVHESKTEVVQEFGVTEFPTLMVVKGDDRVLYEGKMAAVALKAFLETHALPDEPVQAEEAKQPEPSEQEKQALAMLTTQISSLTLANLSSIDEQEPAWLIAFAAGTAEECSAPLQEFNKTVQEMGGVVNVGQLLLTREELKEQKSTLRDHGVDVSALEEAPCTLQIVRFPYGEDKQESEEFATFKDKLDGKTLQAFAVEIIPNLAHDITNLENFLAAPRPDGQPGFAPKVILVTNKDEAPGVYKALAANLGRTTTLMFGYVRASDPSNKAIVARIGMTRVPGLTVAGVMGEGGVSPTGEVKLGFQPYQGQLKYSHMQLFLKAMAQMLGASTEDPEPAAAAREAVPELSTQSALQDLCMDKAGLCVLGMLDGKDDTKELVQVLEAAAQKRGGQPLQFGWVNARTQPSFAAALGVTGTAALPTVVAISIRKQRLAVLRGSFDLENIHSWLDSVLVGRVSTVPMQAMPHIVDGGEADTAAAESVPEEELEPVEEMDLSEILGEEIEGSLGTKAELLEKVEEELKIEEQLKRESEKKSKKKKKKKSKKKKKVASPVKDEL